MTTEQRKTPRAAVDTSIRTAAIWQVVIDVARQRAQQLDRPLRVVDLGGGSGGLAVPLAELGYHVTVVDPSPDALASLERRAREVDVLDRITAVQGDEVTLPQNVPDGGADLLCCHGVLEVLDDESAVVAAADSLARSLAPGGILSLVVAQRLAAVLARALAGRFEQAREALTSAHGRWGDADPMPRRFDADQVSGLLADAGLHVRQAHGVRIFADLVPAAMTDTEADRAALLTLEEAVMTHPSYAFLGHLASALHVIAELPESAA